MLLLKDNPTTQEPLLLNNAFGKDLAFQIAPEMCRFNPLFQFRDFYNKAPRHVFIYWFILCVKHSRCIKHHSHCIWKPRSPADLLNVTELNLFPVFFFFQFFCHFVFVTQKNSVRHFFKFCFLLFSRKKLWFAALLWSWSNDLGFIWGERAHNKSIEAHH